MAATEATFDESTNSVMGTPAPIPVPTHDEKLGRYVLRFALASGGMATVYLAVARGASGFGRPVALKRIHPHLADESDFIEMFLDEARIAARIRHPNVCSVEDFGEADGAYYMTMEYLSGESLSKVARHMGRVPPVVAARIIADACEGLHAAHELEDEAGAPLNVVHRDVSPQNLFVGYDGIVKVVDFGIAKAEDRIHETTVGMVKGKFAYMAPEQLRGEKIDRRADVWSLGVVLWELLAGQKLFRRRNQSETIMAVQRHHVPRLSEQHPDVPPQLDDIIARALAVHRADRFENAREMGSALSRVFAVRGGAIGVPELSNLMGRLFTDRKASQRNLVRSALSSPTPPSHRLFPRLSRDLDEDERSKSGVVQRRGSRPSSAGPNDATRASRPRPSRPRLFGTDYRGALLAFLAAFLATTLVGGGYLLLETSPDPTPARVDSPSPD